MSTNTSKTGRELVELMRSVATDKSVADRAYAKTRGAQQLQGLTDTVQTEVPIDDNAPPDAPDGLTVTPAARALIAVWDVPPEQDHVVRSQVELVNLDTSVTRIVDTTDIVFTFGSLALDDYSVRVRHVDRWGRTGDWCLPVTATPNETVADQINASLQVAASQVFGELGMSNIPTFTTAEKLIGGVVASIDRMGRPSDPFYSAEVIRADLLAAWTVTAGRAIIADATVDSALIANLGVKTANIDDLAVSNAKIALLSVKSANIESIAASKITADVFNAVVSFSTTGRFIAGGAEIDSSGIQLSSIATEIGFPSTTAGSWITPKWNASTPAPRPFAGIGFFEQATVGGNASSRGIAIAADGITGDSALNHTIGYIRLTATDGAQNINNLRTAFINVRAYFEGGRIELGQDAQINRDLFVFRDVWCVGTIQPIAEWDSRVNPGTAYAANETRTFTNASGKPYGMVHAFALSAGYWRPIVDGVNGYGLMWNNNEIVIKNNGTAGHIDVRAWK